MRWYALSRYSLKQAAILNTEKYMQISKSILAIFLVAGSWSHVSLAGGGPLGIDSILNVARCRQLAAPFVIL